MGRRTCAGRARIAGFAVLAGAAAAGALALSGGVAEAGKPSGGGGTGGGTIYFVSQALDWAMGSDGSGKAALPPGVAGQPGYAVHAGWRWFIRMYPVGGTYPDGTGRYEFFAVRNDGQATVQLTDDPNVHAANYPRWTKDDGSFSFPAVDWSAGRSPVTRLFRVAVAFDTAGTPAPATSPAIVTSLSYVNSPAGYPSAIQDHAWSADGARVAWTEVNSAIQTTTSRVTALTDGVTTTLAEARVVTSWSGAGPLLLGDPEHTVIECVDPDGANRRVLVTLSSRHASNSDPDRLFPRSWSPTGSHFTYAGQNDQGGASSEVFRAASDGSGRTNLTGDISYSADEVGWR